MRTNTAAFNEKNQSSSQSVRLVIEIDFSEDGSDLHYFPSHDDTPTISPVTVGVLKNTSSISQKLIPERANSSIGSLSFELMDADNDVTTLFNTKRISRKVLFGKRVRLYLGYQGLPWSEYIVTQTQYIDKKIKLQKGVYFISCKDSQDRMNKQILQPLETRLSTALAVGDTAIEVYNLNHWQLVQRGSSFSDSPNTSVTYLEISDGTNKEYCRVTAIATSFTVVRGVLGTTARAWLLPNDASDEKGPKIKELIFIEGNSLEQAYAIMTGDQIGLAGNLPEHWHLGMDANLFNIGDFTSQESFTAYAFDLKKTDGKKFIESEIMLPNSKFLRINGSGNLDLKRIQAINNDAAIVATLDATNIVKYGDLTFDASDTSNKFEIDWSFDPLPKKQEYRRKSTFVFADSVTDYGEKLKAFKFRLVNGINSTSTTLINNVNALSDRFAGEAARLSVSVLPTLNDLEIADVVKVKHPGIQDFNAGSSIDRSMQIISIKVNQRKGTLDLELFGSTFTPEPLSDGALSVMNDSYYTATGTQIPNITTNSLTINTTLTGSADNSASVFYHAGDLTIPAGVTLSIIDNVELRIKGHLTVLGDIDCAGNGRVSGGGYIGTSIGNYGQRVEINDGSDSLGGTVPGEVNPGLFDSFPTLDLDNNAGNAIVGVPADLRGSAGATGGDSDWTGEMGETEFSDGATGNDSGSALVIVCRGMSLSAAGAIDTSGLAGNLAIESLPNGEITGGDGGHSTPGGLLVLLDGGTSSVPNLTGRITALGNQGLDLKQNAARIQFIPQARIVAADDPIPTPVSGTARFNQPTEPTDLDCKQRYGRVLTTNDIWIDSDDDNNAHYEYINDAWTYLPQITPWSEIIDDGGQPSDNASADITLLSSANMIVKGNRIYRNSIGISDWTEHVYSAESFSNGCSASCVIESISGRCMFALNSDPLTNESYDSLDYAIRIGETNDLKAYENGISKGVIGGAWVVGDTLAITYDGTKIRYIHNGIILRTITTIPNRKFHIDTSFTNGQAILKNVRLQPLSSNNWIDFNGRPINLSSLIGSEGIRNSGIVLNADGTLFDNEESISLGGLTISTLGFVGDLNASYGATWGSNLAGQPPESALLNSAVYANGLLRNNLLSIEEWVDGTATFNDDFSEYSNTSAYSSEIIQSDGPKGFRSLIWRSTCTIDQAGTGSWSGGWSHSIQDTNNRFHHTKSYRLTCWVRLSTTAASFYAGYGSNDVAVLGIGDVARSNPYSFSNNKPPTADKWYLCVAIIHGSSYFGQTKSNISGWYDPVTGSKAKDDTSEFKNLTTSTSLFFRISSYRGNLNDVSEYADPRVDEINGAEPSIIDILGTATVGAAWGSNVIGRPIELTDGRVPGTINGSGRLVELTVIDQGNGTDRNAAMGLGEGLIRDGVAYSFPVSWDQIPTIKFAAGGLVKSGSLAGDHVQSFQATSISTTGFTASLKLKELAGSTTLRTETGATSAGTQDWEINKISAGEAYDDTYTFQFDVTVNNFPDPPDFIPGFVNVGIYTNDGGGWVKRATFSFSGDSSSSTKTYLNQTRSIIVDGLTNHGGREFGINIEAASLGGSLVFDNVKYTTASTPADVTATPSGAPDVQFLVLGGS